MCASEDVWDLESSIMSEPPFSETLRNTLFSEQVGEVAPHWSQLVIAKSTEPICDVLHKLIEHRLVALPFYDVSQVCYCLLYSYHSPSEPIYSLCGLVWHFECDDGNQRDGRRCSAISICSRRLFEAREQGVGEGHCSQSLGSCILGCLDGFVMNLLLYSPLQANWYCSWVNICCREWLWRTAKAMWLLSWLPRLC